MPAGIDDTWPDNEGLPLPVPLNLRLFEIDLSAAGRIGNDEPLHAKWKTMKPTSEISREADHPDDPPTLGRFVVIPASRTSARKHFEGRFSR